MDPGKVLQNTESLFQFIDKKDNKKKGLSEVDFIQNPTVIFNFRFRYIVAINKNKYA